MFSYYINLNLYKDAPVANNIRIGDVVGSLMFSFSPLRFDGNPRS